MIKGAVHQIIELRQPSAPYFERALLFVKPAYADKPRAVLEAEGRELLAHTMPYTGLRHNRAMCWFKRCALVLSGAIGGLLLACFGS